MVLYWYMVQVRKLCGGRALRAPRFPCAFQKTNKVCVVQPPVSRSPPSSYGRPSKYGLQVRYNRMVNIPQVLVLVGRVPLLWLGITYKVQVLPVVRRFNFCIYIVSFSI
jgi:hypothetical protein